MSQPSDQNLQKSAIFANSQTETPKIIKQYQPYRIDIVLDNECNLSCVGCIRTKIKKGSNFDHSKFIIKIIQKESKEKYHIHFTGGEPFLKWNSLTKIIKNTQNSTKKEITYSIYSNLTLLSGEIIEFLKSNKFKIHTSLDGLKTVNDKIRGKGSYETIVANIKLLQKNKITLSSVTTTLKNENIQEISTAFVSELEQLKVKTWRLNIDYYGISIKPQDVVDNVFSLYIYAIERGLNIEGTWLYPFHNLISDNKNGFCPATKGETIAILPDGKISVCPYSESFLETYKEDWKIINKEFIRLRENLSNDLKCSKCIIKDYCQTQCLVTREKSNPVLSNWYCEVYRGLTVRLLNYHLKNEL